MTRRNPLVVVLAAVLVLVVIDVLVSRYWTSLPGNSVVSEVVIFAVVAYIVLAIALRGRWRFPSLPQRRPRMRVVRRDPSKAAADFIKQFEDRTNR